MTNGEIFQLTLERLKAEPFLNGFKFRKRDSSFLKQDGDLRQSILNWIIGVSKKG